MFDFPPERVLREDSGLSSRTRHIAGWLLLALHVLVYFLSVFGFLFFSKRWGQDGVRVKLLSVAVDACFVSCLATLDLALVFSAR